MDRKLSQEKNNRTRLYFAGAGLVLGAGLGTALSTLLFENLPWAIGIGAGMGLVIGAAMDSYKNRASGTRDMNQG